MPKTSTTTAHMNDLHPRNLLEKQRRKDVKAIRNGFPDQKSLAFKALHTPAIQERVLNYLISYDVRIDYEGVRRHACRQQRDLVSMSLTCKAFWWNAMKVKWRELADLEPLLDIWREIGVLSKEQGEWNPLLSRQPQALDWTTIYRYTSQIQTLSFLREPTPGASRQIEIIFLVRHLYNAAKGREQDQILCNVSRGIGLMPRLFPSLRIVEWECVIPVDLQCLGMVLLASPEIERVVIGLPHLFYLSPEDYWLWDYHMFYLWEYILVHARPIQHLEINRLPILYDYSDLSAMTSTAAIARYIFRSSGLRHLTLPAQAMECKDLFGICCHSKSLQTLQFLPSTASRADRLPAELPASPENGNLKYIYGTTRIITALASYPEGICTGLEQLLIVEDSVDQRLPARALPGFFAYLGTQFAPLKVLWIQTTLKVPHDSPGSRLNSPHPGPLELGRRPTSVLACLGKLGMLEELHVELNIVPDVPWFTAILPSDFILSDEDWKIAATLWPKLRKLWYSCELLENTSADNSGVHTSQDFQSYTTLAPEGYYTNRVATIRSILDLLYTCRHLQSITIPFTCRRYDCENQEYGRRAALFPEKLRQRGLDGLEIGLQFADVDEVIDDDLAIIVNFWDLLTLGVKNARFTGIDHSTMEQSMNAVSRNPHASFMKEWLRQMQWVLILNGVGEGIPSS